MTYAVDKCDGEMAHTVTLGNLSVWIEVVYVCVRCV